MRLLDEVRDACARVTRLAEHVIIAVDPADYARRLDLAALPLPTYDRVHHYHSEDPEALARYIVVLDSVNFGSGSFPYLRKRPGMSGYFTIASRLKDIFEVEGPLEAERLVGVGVAEVAALLGQDLDHPIRAELMVWYARALADLGRFLLDRHGGQALTLVHAAEGRVERLVSELIAMPLFRDVARYRDVEVPFYKRAQITASDLALAFAGTGPGAFHDLERLTIFADNLVPHVLWCDGVLQLAPALAARIGRGEAVAAGSPEEVELRAVALHAVERMVAGLRADGLPVNARQLDLLLWNRGLARRYREMSRQRTRTPFY